jgi:hypothetical protein
VAAAPVYRRRRSALQLAARYLRMNGSSRLIGPFRHGTMATALVSFWLEQVCELIAVADAWLATA